jgi:hypothetical protein
MVFCDASWASEQWSLWRVEVFPDLAAVQRYSQLLQELNVSRYLESITLLGTEWQAE